ncbi:MAG: hypothetical protein K6E27_10130 [Eubacterium sp.]|nr:hypothetical protein [Eubacterium sp.]
MWPAVNPLAFFWFSLTPFARVGAACPVDLAGYDLSNAEIERAITCFGQVKDAIKQLNKKLRYLRNTLNLFFIL